MIGSSIGMAYQDEFHMEASPYIQEPMDSLDKNVQTPDQMGQNQQMDQLEQTELGGIEVAKKNDMPYPNNNNPDSDFNSRFGNLPKNGILNDIKPSDPLPPLMRKISDEATYPIEVDDILNNYYKGDLNTKQVHEQLGVHGWSADLRGKNQVQIWGVDGKVIYHPD